jgi:O-methyltransferase domain
MTNTDARVPGPASFEAMFSMITGYWVTQIARAVATCSIAEHISEGRDTAAAIAEAESTDPDATRRLLRAASALGLTTTADGVHHEATDLLLTLRKDVPGSLWGFAVSQAASGHWRAWGRFTEAVRTGQRQTVPVHGMEIWELFGKDEPQGAAFTRSMREMSFVITAEARRLVDTSAATRAVDVGGAGGSLVQSLMQANHDLHGVVIDRPVVVPDAVAAAERAGLADRFAVVGGDFFESVPAGDLFLLRFILHDWNDEQCVRILGNVRRGLAPGGKVVVVELLVGAPDEPGLAALMDLNMLTMTSGRERDIGEFDALFAAAGLRRTTVTPTNSPFTIIEAVAAE